MSSCSVLALLLCLPVALQAQFTWNCDQAGNKRIVGSRTYCCGLNAIVSHCLAVVDLEDGSSMVTEQEGNGRAVSNCKRKKGWLSSDKNYDRNGCYIEGGAYIMCVYQPTKVTPNDLITKSKLFGMGSQKYKVIPQQSSLKAASFIAGYAESGLIFGAGHDKSIKYPMTGNGLKQWAQDYYNKFPYYRAMSTNCQKYSVGVYNSVTHSSKAPKQWYSSIVSPFMDFTQMHQEEYVEINTTWHGKDGAVLYGGSYDPVVSVLSYAKQTEAGPDLEAATSSAQLSDGEATEPESEEATSLVQVNDGDGEEEADATQQSGGLGILKRRRNTLSQQELATLAKEQKEANSTNVLHNHRHQQHQAEGHIQLTVTTGHFEHESAQP